MIKTYKFISTFKKNGATGNQPTHSILAKQNMKDEKGVFVASLWSKDINGNKFLSGKMDDAFVDMDGAKAPREGYVIVSETDLNGLITALREYKAKLGEVEDDPTYPKNENIQDIPF